MTENATVAPARPLPDDGWISTDVFMLRVGGLPWSAVRPLACDTTAEWADAILARESGLKDRARGISDTLEPLVTEYDNETRRVLLSLRRDIFNFRVPRGRARLTPVMERLPEDVRRAVGDWIEEREELERRRAEGRTLLSNELAEQRSYLRELADDPRLRHGLLLASPSLERYLPAYLDAAPGALSKRARKIERSLLEYVFRTACKTSPFSTLTTVATGTFEPLAGVPLGADPRGLAGHSHVRVNMAALGRIASSIAEDWERLTDLPVALSSGHSLDRERIRYVRRTKLSGDAEDPAVFESLREELFFISNSGLLNEIMALLADEPGMRLGELQDRLADVGGREPEELRTYLRALIRLSLLTLPSLDIDIHSDDPLRTFRDGLAVLDRPWSDTLVTELDRTATLADTYPEAGTTERRELRDAVHATLNRALKSLVPEAAELPPGVLYEDVSLPDLDVRADKELWDDTLLHDLQGLTGILPLFDMLLPHRLILLGFFRARYGESGTCDDVLKFVHEFHLDIYDQYLQAGGRRKDFDEQGEYVPLDNWLRMPEIDALNDARVELIGRMREAYSALPDPEEELVLGDDFMTAVAEKLPPAVQQLDSRSFFLQVAQQGDRALGVVNRSYSGLTLLYSRFLHCFQHTREPALVDELRETLLRVCPEDAVLAELTGGYDSTNLNLHPAVTEFEIVCPGESSSRPEAECIRVEELQIRHSPDKGLHLYCPRIDRTVIPVYLGFLMPLALPEVQRALLLFSPTAMAPLDLWQGTDKPLGDSPIGGHPRVRYRDLVLARHTWKMTPSHLPRREKGQDEADWFLSWQRWRRENGLPRRVFAAVDTLLGDRKDGAEEAGATHPTKPQYVDFDNYFSLQSLDHMATRAERRVVMTEMLPAPDELWLQGEDGAYVTEQTVEITRTPRAGSDRREGEA
ncbi:lantibiotic dehydratase [Nocardiopsis sp. JB363]|uniref:lantibiotic dehydratase n=1 Tax=Nocardiopsis sp. JB363 TaxID=1434837 RepID=UPI00097A69B9|nr:lantibiotic dehydratase [Nocardiopsis sp. JB363]SIO85747.1 Lanthionine biosynthesis protein LanB [Nocardiopsis sp. JB363]